MLISDEYCELNRQLHLDRPDYGTSGHKYAAEISNLIKAYNIKSVLDYGAGKCTLQKALPNIDITNYDPCIDGLDVVPGPHDLVICSDVLEHVEPEYVNDVIADIKCLSMKVLFIKVATRLAGKILADGRNAHISIHPSEWWTRKFNNLHRITYKEIPDRYFIASYLK